MPPVVVAILASCCKWIQVRYSSYIVSLPRSDQNPRKRIYQSLPNRESRPRQLGRHRQLQPRLRRQPRRMQLLRNHPCFHRPLRQCRHPPPRGTEPGCPPVLIVVRTSTHDTTGATFSAQTMNSPPPSPPPTSTSTSPPPLRTHPLDGPTLKSKPKDFFKYLCS